MTTKELEALSHFDTFRTIEEEKSRLDKLRKLLMNGTTQIYTRQHYAKELDMTFVLISLWNKNCDDEDAEFLGQLVNWYMGEPEASFEEYLHKYQASLTDNVWLVHED